jgi:SNF2 family DNA or RNA helicase
MDHDELDDRVVLNPGLFRYPPEEGQLEGATELANRPRFLLGDAPGAGKTKQVIDAACGLYLLGEVDTVLVICPAQVMLAWLDEDFGEIVKHSYTRGIVQRLNSHNPILPDLGSEEDAVDRALVWGVCSFEMVRNQVFLNHLCNELRGRRLLVVIDESLRISNWKADQHQACKRIVHNYAQFAWELNGTPGTPVHLFGQFEVLDPRIIGVKNFFHFRARYCRIAPIFPGSTKMKVVGFENRDLLDARIRDFTLRRVPPLSVARSTMPPLGASMDARTWKTYKDMRDQALSALDAAAAPGEGQVARAANAMAKTLRLCQITGGFVGGIEAGPLAPLFAGVEAAQVVGPVRWLSDHKIKIALEWLEDRWEEDDQARPIVWCRFTREREELVRALMENNHQVWQIVGGQNKKDREESVRAMTPSTRSNGPGVCVGQPQAGGLGLTLTAGHDTLYYSSTWSWFDRDQTEGRTARKTQRSDCRFWDLLATGPEGQKTVDHKVLKTIREGGDIAMWTIADWREAVGEE